MPSPPEPRRAPLDATRFLAQGKSLTRPVLVGGTFQTAWVVVPFAIAAISIGIGLVIGLRGGIPEIIFYLFLPVAAVACIPGVIALAIQFARRRWMEVTDSGFVVIFRNAQRRRFEDEQIVAITQRTWGSSDGSYFRRVVVEVAADEYLDPIECFYHVAAGQADPLHWFVDRNVRSLAKRTADNLHLGARLNGVGWHYDRDGLHLHHGPQRGTYSVDELTYLAFFDGHLQLWRGIEELPLVRIPDTSRNAHTLGQVLWAPMENRPGLHDPLPGRPLGRRLFIKYGRDHWVGWILAIVFGAATTFLILASIYHPGPAERITFAILAGLSCFLLLLGAWLIYRTSYMRLAYHQFGIAQPGRNRSLLFTDMERMLWTANTITFEPAPNVNQLPIYFQSMSINFDNDMVGMRDYVASVIANRWWTELAQGPVKWTASLRFLPGGLEYRPAGMFGRGEPITAPYHITSYYLLAEWMELFVTGEPRAVLKQPYKEMNFYPGLILLNWIYESMRQQAQQQGQPPNAEVRPDFSLPYRGSERVVSADRPDQKVTPGD